MYFLQYKLGKPTFLLFCIQKRAAGLLTNPSNLVYLPYKDCHVYNKLK